jgi:hypothetical protein
MNWPAGILKAYILWWLCVTVVCGPLKEKFSTNCIIVNICSTLFFKIDRLDMIHLNIRLD